MGKKEEQEEGIEDKEELEVGLEEGRAEARKESRRAGGVWRGGGRGRLQMTV